jgi:cardiolipin synthase
VLRTQRPLNLPRHAPRVESRFPLRSPPRAIESNASHAFGYTKVIAATAAVTAFLGLLLFNLAAGEKKITYQIEHRYDVSNPQFLQSMGVLLGPALTHGNRVETLLNGDQIFGAMLKDIRRARKTITFETYIYWSGDIGTAFSEALSERARNGVKVHVLLDWLGSQKMDEAALASMRKAGVEVERYHPVKWVHAERFNNRTHRKLLVVDGVIGFTGGVGIADKWSGNAQDPDHWRDTHYRVEGPVVAQMQATFMDNWTKVTGKCCTRPSIFLRKSPPGTITRRCFKARSREEAGACISCTCSRSQRRARASISRWPTSLRTTWRWGRSSRRCAVA